jgi:C4-dicarboxylate transporter DctM subunit
MIIIGVIALAVLTVLGLPLFAAILCGAMLGLWSSGVDLAAIPIEMYRLANAPVLLAIPLFTLAGYLLAEGETSARLVRFSRSVFGWVPGGLGVVALVSCAFFTAITGATGITIIALGGLLLPALVSEHYKESFSLGLVTISGSLGLHFPPSLPIILYGFVSGVNIETLFVAGFLPGVLMVAVPCLFSIWVGKRWRLERPAFSLKELFRSLRQVAWELPIPLLILGTIYSGVATATETSALTAAYVLFVKTVVFKEVRLFRDLPRIMIDATKMVGAILIILGAALGLTNYLVDAFIPMKILDALEGVVGSKVGFLVVLNVFLILVGCMMDIFSAILVVVPLIMPLADRFGVEPLHLGVVFLANLAIGYNTPPVGLNLFVASSRFEEPVVKLYRATLPFLLLQLITLALITYWPALSLFLPSLLTD